jgi:hypothetical protein
MMVHIRLTLVLVAFFAMVVLVVFARWSKDLFINFISSMYFCTPIDDYESIDGLLLWLTLVLVISTRWFKKGLIQ